MRLHAARGPAVVAGRAPRVPVSGRLTASEQAVLRLQRTAGNQAFARHLVQRATPGVPGVGFKTSAELDALTIGNLDDYARKRPDWGLDPDLPKARRRTLEATLEFMRAGDPAPVSACDGMAVKDVEATGLKGADRAKLRAYARGVESSTTAGVESTAVVADAESAGDAIARLERGVPPGVAHQAMGTTPEGKAAFKDLVGAGEVDNFATYVRRSHAYLEAKDGADVQSYLAMVNRDGKHPADYIGRPAHVHNYHRFLAPMLDTLAKNEGDTSRKRPLLLILHSGSDHNGAFHRDAELQAVVDHPRNLTIMVEGPKSLAAAGDVTEAVARRYGPRGKIQQVMLAGHGGPTSIELAGTQDKSGTFKGDDVDVANNKARTVAFLKRLVAKMEKGPDARIVLNACLTAADEVSGNLPADPKAASAAIVSSLKTSPSLATKLQDLAGRDRTVEGNISSVPAGEYMERDPVSGKQTGILHQIIPSDPYATSTNRGDYVEHGVEPEGAMRALVTLWALDRAEAIKRVAARRAQPIGDWQDKVIHVFYDLFAANPDNASFMNRIANSVARGLSEFHHPAEQVPAWVGGLYGSMTKAEAESIIKPLYGSMASGARLAIEQIWMLHEPARQAEFMKVLDTFATTVAAAPHLDNAWLAPSTAKLLPVGSATAPSRAQMKLALYGISHDPQDANAKAFLIANLKGGRTFTMPAGTTIAGLTGNASSDSGALADLGLLGEAPSGSVNPPPNYDIDGDGKADVYIDSLTRHSVVTARMLNIRERPDRTSRRVDTVAAGHAIVVIGVSGDWYAIEHRNTVRFTHRAYVRDRSVA